MMLVQTTVAAVVPYFERFLARFPTVAALAAADEAEVLKAWEGLGYYRRARQLHAAARAIVARPRRGRSPTTPRRSGPCRGSGGTSPGRSSRSPSTGPAPIVEANTQRVLARWLAWRGDLKASATQARLWEAAGRLVPPSGAGHVQPGVHGAGRPGLHAQGAAAAWSARSPAECRARALGLQDALPVDDPQAAAAGVGRGVRPGRPRRAGC